MQQRLRIGETQAPTPRNRPETPVSDYLPLMLYACIYTLNLLYRMNGSESGIQQKTTMAVLQSLQAKVLWAPSEPASPCTAGTKFPLRQRFAVISHFGKLIPLEI